MSHTAPLDEDRRFFSPKVRRFFSRIITKSVIFFMTGLFLGGMVRTYFFSNAMYRQIEAQAVTEKQNFFDWLALDFQHNLQLRHEMLQRLLITMPPDLASHPAALHAWLRQQAALVPQFSLGLALEDQHGQLIAQYPQHAAPFLPTQANHGGRNGQPTANINAKLNIDLSINHTEPGTMGGQPALSTLTAGDVGKLRLRGLSLLAMPDWVNQVSTYKNSQPGRYFLVFPREGQWLALGDPVNRLQALPPGGVEALFPAPAPIKLTDLKATHAPPSAIFFKAVVPGTVWIIVTSLPHKENVDLTRILHRQTIITLLITVGLGGLVVAFWGGFILAPLKRAARHAERINRDDTLLEPFKVESNDEVGDVTAAFNRVLKKLADQSTELIAQKEVAESAALAKSRFLAAASHDLRQPMHALNLYLGALASHDLPVAAQPVLASVRHCAQTMDGMFRTLLDISKLDAQTLRAEPGRFPIATLLDKIQIEFSGQAEEKGLRLRVAPCRACVDTDPELLNQILRNLVSNAIRYTKAGKVLVGCRRRAGRLQLEVLDTGIGIAPEDQQTVFEEFYQVGNPERDRTQGLGLGLAIVQRLARLLRTPLSLQSTPGKGTVFAIDLPLTTAPKISLSTPLPGQPPPSQPLQSGSTPGPHWPSQPHSQSHSQQALIAIIDDEELILDATRMLLEQAGYQALAASSGAAIIQLLAGCERMPDLIICDHRLRDNETGVEVIQRLRDEFNSDIPALLITGDTAPERIQAILETRIPILHKPLEDWALKQAVTRLLQGSN
jgi:signal transduction histidine kinase/CheY-like chemotaxis protein